MLGIHPPQPRTARPAGGCCRSLSPWRRSCLRAAERTRAFSSVFSRAGSAIAHEFAAAGGSRLVWAIVQSEQDGAVAGRWPPDHNDESVRLLRLAVTFVAKARALRKVLFRSGRAVMRAESIPQTRHRSPPCARFGDMHTTIHIGVGISEIPPITPLCLQRSLRACDVNANSIVRHRDRAFVSRREGAPAATSPVLGRLARCTTALGSFSGRTCRERWDCTNPNGLERNLLTNRAEARA
jgi:hypothetical protein